MNVDVLENTIALGANPADSISELVVTQVAYIPVAVLYFTAKICNSTQAVYQVYIV
jgi:hypothetical protein